MEELINRKLSAILKEFQEETYRKYQCSFSYGIVEVKGKDNVMSLDDILKEAVGRMDECQERNIAKYPSLCAE